MKKLDNRGFTLVELLATLAVLSLVSTIVIYVAINVVNSAKDKSYLVTINNVEKAAVSYLEENNDKIHFVKYDDDLEYQCVTVQSLIDTNYFDKDVLNSKISKDKILDSNNYIYIERDSNNKTVTNSKLIADSNSDYNTLCGKASLDGTIDFVISPSGFAREKNVDIKYCLYNVSDYKNVEYFSQYNDLIYNDENSDNTFSDNCLIRKVTVNENGDMIAKILKRNTDGNKEEVKSAVAKVSSIDNKAPVINIEPNGDNTYTKSKTININISDDLSGVSSDSTIKYGFSKSKNEEPSSYKEVKVNGDIKIIESSLTGEYYLWIKPNVKDNAGNVNNDTLISDVYKFDNTAPSIPTYIAKYRDGSGDYTSGSNANKEVVTEISATDPDSGVEGIYYSKDKINKTKFNFGVLALTQNGSTWSGTESWDFRDGRNDSYYFMACDKVGNCSKWSNVFNIKYKTNKVYIKYNANRGSMVKDNGYGIDSDGMITKNGSILTTKINYLGKLGSKGLYNVNNKNKINLSKLGYSAVSGKEWCTKSDGSGTCYDQATQYSANNFCDASSRDCEVILYANWRANKLTIIYHSNGGSMSKTNGGYENSDGIIYMKNNSGKYISNFHVVKYGNDVVLKWSNYTKGINLVKTGYSLVSGSEWCTKSDGSGTCYNQNPTGNYKKAEEMCSKLSSGDCTINLYAHWKVNKLTIIYHSNGGSMSKTNGGYENSDGIIYMKNNSGKYISNFHVVKYGNDVVLKWSNYTKGINLVKTGYSLVSGSEWCTKSDGSGTCYNQNPTGNYKKAEEMCSKLSSDDCTVHLYAHWKKNVCPTGYVKSSTKYDCEKLLGSASQYYTKMKKNCLQRTTSPTKGKCSDFNYDDSACKSHSGCKLSDNYVMSSHLCNGTYKKCSEGTYSSSLGKCVYYYYSDAEKVEKQESCTVTTTTCKSQSDKGNYYISSCVKDGDYYCSSGTLRSSNNNCYSYASYE